MDTLLRLFLKVVGLPSQVSLNTFFHVIMVVAGIATLYLLTLREDEEGKIEDYLKRLWNRMGTIQQKALSRHQAFINVTASAITSAGDKLFGTPLFSIQAVGVSISLALFFLNAYLFIASSKNPPISWAHFFNAFIFLGLALFPWLIDSFLSRKRPRLNRPRQTDWLFWWVLILMLYLIREYVSPFMCVSCVPAQFQNAILLMFLIMIAVAILGTALFTSFVVITRFSLKKLSLSNSALKSIALLLIGCIPIPIFWLLLRGLVFVVTHAEFTSRNPSDPTPVSHFTKSEWVALGSFVVFALAFFINSAFLLAPALFFSMATLLGVHRLLWPIIVRPLEKLKNVGIMNHPRIITTIGLVMILVGIGKLEWIEKALKFVGLM